MSKQSVASILGRRKGVTLVELLVVVAIIALLLQLILPAVRKSREAARRVSCINNLRQIGMAANSYTDAYKHTPTQQINTEPADAGHGSKGKGMFNSLVFLLPYLEQQSVYDQIDFNHHAPYATDINGPNHSDGKCAKIAAIQIPVFLCPLDTPGNKTWDDQGNIAANNNYVGNVGWPYNSSGLHGETGAKEGKYALPNGYLTVVTFRSVDRMRKNAYLGEWRDVMVGVQHITDGLSKTAAYSERLINKNYMPDVSAEVYPRPDLRLLRLQFGSKEVLTQQEHYDICRGIDIVDSPKRISKTSIYNGATWLSGGGETANTYQHLMTPNTRSCIPYFDSWWVGNEAFTPSSFHPGGINVVMADGSTHFVNDEIDRVVWWGIGSRNLDDASELP